MRLDVALLPRDCVEPETSVCIVVDALRASSTIAVLFGRGAALVAVAGTIEDARLLYRDMPDSLLCGEVGGLPPDGFDFGNSPAEFEATDLEGRRLVLATSNGTRALAALDTARAVYTGSLLNRAAVVQAAVAAAGGAISVVCSGTELGTRFSLEDTVVAGALVDEICRVLDDSIVERTDTATAARRLWHTYGAAPRQAFDDSVHGQLLLDLGFDADLDLCARLDRYPVAPRLQVTVDGRLLLRDWGAPPPPQRE